jgi:hypothetical protein
MVDTYNIMLCQCLHLCVFARRIATVMRVKRCFICRFYMCSGQLVAHEPLHKHGQQRLSFLGGWVGTGLVPAAKGSKEPPGAVVVQYTVYSNTGLPGMQPVAVGAPITAVKSNFVRYHVA